MKNKFKILKAIIFTSFLKNSDRLRNAEQSPILARNTRLFKSKFIEQAIYPIEHEVLLLL